MVKKICCLTAVVLLIFSLMCVPASASGLTGRSQLLLTGVDNYGTGGNTFVYPNIPVSNFSQELTPGYNKWRLIEALSPAGTNVTTTVGFYISYYFRSGGAYTWTYDSSVLQSSSYQATYINNSGAQGTVSSVDVKSFTPAKSDLYSNSIGVTLKTEFAGTDTLPIRNLRIATVPTNYMYFVNGGSNTISNFIITSFKVVDAADQATLDALESLADAIAAQSEILMAMYGDIMEVLSAIYQCTGDIYYAQELANSYFRTMIDYLESLDSTTEDIYALLQAQFQLLIATINTESEEIQNAIDQQTHDLISYLERTFNSAVGSLPDDNESTQGVIDNAHENEEEYTADALGKFQEISATFNGFNGSVGSGVAVASTLFSRVWSAMGDYVIVYTFPLTLGLALVVVGRSSRVQSKDTNDKGKGGEEDGLLP